MPNNLPNWLAEKTKEEILSALLHQQLEYYQAILEVSIQEHALFQKKCSLQEIYPLMQQKQILLCYIDEIEISLAPLREWWGIAQNRQTVAAQMVFAKLAELHSTIEQILALDQQNQQLIAFKN